MRETYKTIKGDAGIDFANMARQLAAELRVGIHASCFLLVCLWSLLSFFIVIIITIKNG